MSASDRIHRAVKNALIKDGWTITADPYPLRFEELRMAIDLAADRLMALERRDEFIAVEIKTFGSPSPVYEPHNAVGQFVNYSALLSEIDPDRVLFLAISDSICDELFVQKGVQMLVVKSRLRLLVVDILSEEVIRWIT